MGESDASGGDVHVAVVHHRPHPFDGALVRPIGVCAGFREVTGVESPERLHGADDYYAAVSSAGMFTQGHAPLSGFDELIRITRSGGCIVFSVSRTYLDGEFEEKGKSLEEAGLWTFVDTSAKYNSTPLEGELPARVYAYQVA